MYIISTLKANKVNAQEMESGSETPIKVFRRPCLITRNGKKKHIICKYVSNNYPYFNYMPLLYSEFLLLLR